MDVVGGVVIERLDDDWMCAEREQDRAEDAALFDAGGGGDGLAFAVLEKVGMFDCTGVRREEHAEHGSSLVLL